MLSDFSRDLNIETRRTSITQTIFYHYANLIQCDLYSGDNAGHIIPYKSEETNISDFVDDIYTKEDTSGRTTREFDYEFADLDELTGGIYSNENNINNRQRRADVKRTDVGG